MLGRLAPGVALASMAALVLVGCSPAEPEPTSPPASPSAEATIDEAALSREARDAWDAYLQRISELEADPESATSDALSDVATQELAAQHLEALERAAALQVRTDGARSTSFFELVDFADAPSALGAHACVDASQVRVVGEDGSDETPADAPGELRYSALLERGDDGRLLVAAADRYSGPDDQDPCA